LLSGFLTAKSINIANAPLFVTILPLMGGCCR